MLGVIAVLPQHNLTARQLQGRNLGVANGLSDQRVHCLLRDTRGFLWIGTAEGLNKYDGYTFRHYHSEPFSKGRLRCDAISSICEDVTGAIWVGTHGGGIGIIDRRTDSVATLSHTPEGSGLQSNDIQVMVIDNITLWVLYVNGSLDAIDTRTREVRNKGVPLPSHAYAIRGAQVDGRGSIVFDAAQMSHRYDTLSGSCRPIVAAIPNQEAMAFVRPIARMGEQTWMAFVWPRRTASALIAEVDIRAGHIITLLGSVPAVSILCAHKDISGNLFIGTPDGLITLHTQDGRLQRYGDGSSGHTPRQRIESIARGLNGEVWVGTGDGVYSMQPAESPFTTFPLLKSGEQGTMMAARALATDRHGRVWAGSDNSQLFVLDTIPGKFLPLALRKSDRGRLPTWSANRIAPGHDDHTMWATTSGASLLRIDINSKTIDAPLIHSGISTAPLGGNAYGLWVDKDSSVWFGRSMVATEHPGSDTVNSGAALIHYYPVNGRSVSYRCSDAARSYSGSQAVWTIFCDSRNTLWIGTPDGLFRFDRVTETFKHIVHNPDDSTSIGGNNVWSIYEDSHGRLWCGTWGGGLNLFDRETETFRHFTKEGGLPSSHIQAIIEDNNARIWFSTNSGLGCLNPVTGLAQHIEFYDGAGLDTYWPNACAKDARGNLYFGGASGVTCVNPERLWDRAPSSRIMITGLSVFGNRRLAEMDSGTTVTLQTDEHFISFEFSDLASGRTDQTRYTYMLEGVDKDWVHTESRFASYTNVSPGTYTFTVRSSNSVNALNECSSIVTLVIPAPVWMRGWFVSVACLVVAGLAGAHLFRRSIRRTREEERIDAAREVERLEIASDLHDGPLQDLYALRFVLFSDSPDRISQLDQELSSIRSSLRAISTKLLPLRFERGVHTQLHSLVETMQQNYPGITFSLTTEGNDTNTDGQNRALYRIVRTLLFNVVRHARATECSVSYVCNDRGTTVVVHDNGRGFVVNADRAPATTHGGSTHGLLLCKTYAHALGATLIIESTPGKGTMVRTEVLHPGLARFLPARWRGWKRNSGIHTSK
jgi:ligand-binding sensor domain-containing protein/signal transduction histidine kinase